MKQNIITSDCDYRALDDWLGNKKVFVVSGKTLELAEGIAAHLGKADTVRFSGFSSNPDYASVVKGVECFKNSDCDAIMAVGGGSAIDVAKCIKIFSVSGADGSDGGYLKCSSSVYDTTPFLAVPTTAGSGSEATRFAVIYHNGVKQSVTNESCMPDTILFDPECLRTLPLYQRKSTMSDALCHAIESFWSVNSSDESKYYAKEAIKGILDNISGYLGNTDSGNSGMLNASYNAGRAINITQTTAGHAMCYKITSLFGTAHGHSAMLCNRVLYKWMLQNIGKCRDSRGEDYLRKMFAELGDAMGCDSAAACAARIEALFDSLGFEIPVASSEQYFELKKSVNHERLMNNPIDLDESDIDMLYHEILR